MDEEDLNGLPRGVAISWGLAKEPQRGPKREMSIGQIVEAAIAIADKEGLAALSMNRVASSLGYTTMSLYRYVSSKDDLLLLMQEAVCDTDIPPEREDGDWREEMREYVRLTVGVFVKHPWFGDIPVSGIPLTPNHLKVVDWALRPLRHLPFNDFEKMSIVLLISGYARSIGMIERDLERAHRSAPVPGAVEGLAYFKALSRLIDPARYPHLYPTLVSGAYIEHGESENPVGNDFDFGLERILDGIEHYLEARKAKERQHEDRQ